jgi:hypothetical protein
MSGLQILEVKKPKKAPDTAPPPLPPHAFLMGIVAPPRSGKSNLLMTIIGASHMYGREYFEEIYYLSPSQNFDDTTRHLLPKLDNLMQIDDPSVLENADVIVAQIMSQQAKDKPEDRKRVLLVFDDCAGLLNKNKQLQKLATKYRHYGMSIIVSVQCYKAIPVMVRTSMTCFIHFNIPNEKDYFKMCEEIHCRFPNGEEMGRIATQKRYNFAYLHLENAEFYHNFDTLLYSRATDHDFD